MDQPKPFKHESNAERQAREQREKAQARPLAPKTPDEINAEQKQAEIKAKQPTGAPEPLEPNNPRDPRDSRYPLKPGTDPKRRQYDSATLPFVECATGCADLIDKIGTEVKLAVDQNLRNAVYTKLLRVSEYLRQLGKTPNAPLPPLPVL
jgi:hypothetical protein